MARRILTIEDDAAIRRGIVDALRYAGYDVLEAATGETGRRMALEREYDLLLLDLVLPGVAGLDILRAVRQLRPTQAVIILTAKGDESDRVDGLRGGADDYVVKPFGVKELLARVEAVLRRSPQRPGDITEMAIPGGRIDWQRQETRFDDGARTALAQLELELLRYLVQHANRAVSRAELLANVWQIDAQGTSTRAIDMHVARLRGKLRDDAEHPRILLTVRGKGYMFATPGETSTP